MERLLLAGDVDSVRMRVVVSDEHAGQLKQSVFESGRFTSIHVRVFDRDLMKAGPWDYCVTRENPFLTADQLGQLDERGMIRAGEIVREGTILASILQSEQAADADRQLEAGMTWGEDDSLAAPSGWIGSQVAGVSYHTREELGKGQPKVLRAELEVRLEGKVRLEIGDALVIEHWSVNVNGTVAALPGDAELAISSKLGGWLEMAPGEVRELAVGKGERAETLVTARATGAVSLINKQPIGRAAEYVDHAHVAWLRARNCDALVAEFAALKSDDIHRNRWYSQAEFAQPDWQLSASPRTTPNSLQIFALELAGLGATVDVSSTADCVALRLSPWLDDEIRATSGGLVTKPETLNYRTYKPEPKGIFCTEIFGPEDRERLGPHGHLELAAPVVPPIYRLGESPLLARLLQMPPRDIDCIVDWQADVDLSSGEIAIVEHDHERTPDDTYLGAGASAIATLLARLPEERIPVGLRGRMAALTPRVIPVVPPDLRPLVLLSSGNFATADINDLYRRVINRTNRLRKLRELKAPAAIISDECRMLQQSIDALHANGALPSRERVMGAHDRPLIDLLDLVTSRAGQKRVDFSGRARAFADSEVPRYEVLLPELIFDRLLCRDDAPILLATPSGEFGFVACYPRRHTLHVILVHPAVAGVLPGEVLCVHRPITRAACEEAQHLADNPPLPQREVPVATSWLAADSPGEAAACLAELLASGETVRLDSALGLLLGGPGPVEFAERGRADPRRAPPRLQVPASLFGS